MTARNGKPCGKCGTSEWDKYGGCKECKRERTRLWQKSNPDKHADKSRRWYADNPEIVRERTRLWQRANPEKCNAQVNRRRARRAGGGGSYTQEEFEALCSYYGNKCLRCGRSDVKLEFDHVIPVSKGGSSDISNGQPLCRKCNTTKSDKTIDYRPDAGPLRWLQAKLFG